MLRDQRQAEPHAFSAAAPPRTDAAREPLEHEAALVLGDAGPVVLDRDLHRIVDSRHRD